MSARLKTEYVRSEAYRRYVASRACFACGIEGWSQAAHPNQAKYGKGRGIKSGDQHCFPLCAPHFGLIGCHAMHDLCVGIDRHERDAKEDEYVERMKRLAARDGWIDGQRNPGATKPANPLATCAAAGGTWGQVPAPTNRESR